MKHMCRKRPGRVFWRKTMIKQEIKHFKLDIGEHKSLAAAAPCSIYGVLAENGVIGDIHVGENAIHASCFADIACTFTSEFEITPLVMSMKNVYIRFYGLDTLCRIEINGCEIALTDNMHRTYTFEIKTKLKVGTNVLKLCFSPVGASSEVRKSRFTFGTASELMPADMGICGKIEIIAFNHKMISDLRISQTHLDRSVQLDMYLDTVGHDDMSRAVATLTSPAGNVYFCGFMNGRGTITVNDPNLWWPNGMGVQNLYRLSVNLYSDSEVEDTYDMNIGLRTVKLEKGDTGRHFLTVNGEEMLVMSSRLVPPDVIHGAVSADRLSALIGTAGEAKLNAIFISSDSYYPESALLDACDRTGIAVILEIPSSPLSASAKDGLADELCTNLKRISYHPSFFAAVGNSEFAELYSPDDRSALESRIFPCEGCAILDFDGVIGRSLAHISHIGMPTYESIKKFLDPSERNLGSLAFETHGSDAKAVMSMLADAYDIYPYASGMKELSYVMGMSAADKTKTEVEQIRALPHDDKPLGIVVGQLNDPWGTLSPSAVDYYGGVKPVAYFARSFCAPVSVIPERNGTRMKFRLSNISRLTYEGVFDYAVMDSTNRPVFKDSFPIISEPMSDMELHNVDLGSILSGHENDYYIKCSVFDKTSEPASNIFLFVRPKRFNLPKPDFVTEITGSRNDFVLTLSCSCLALGVHISFSECEVSVSDNYFNVTSRHPVKVKIHTESVTTVEKLRRTLRIASVYDLGKEV